MSEKSELPTVSITEAFEDQQWFSDNPHRQYRLRPGWAVRRRGRDTFLRTPHEECPYPDNSEAAAERLWWQSAWPELAPLERGALAKAARRRSTPILNTQKRRQR